MYWIILGFAVSLIFTAIWSCLLVAAGVDLRWKRFNAGNLKPVTPTAISLGYANNSRRNLNRKAHRLGRWLAYHHAVY